MIIYKLKVNYKFHIKFGVMHIKICYILSIQTLRHVHLSVYSDQHYEISI